MIFIPSKRFKIEQRNTLEPYLGEDPLKSRAINLEDRQRENFQAQDIVETEEECLFPETKHGFNIEWNNNLRISISKLNAIKIFEGTFGSEETLSEYYFDTKQLLINHKHLKTSFNAKDSSLKNKLLMMRRIQSMKSDGDQ